MEMEMAKRRVTSALTLCTILLLCCVTHEARAWLPGSDGKVQWDYRCDFQGQDLRNQQATSAKCGDICGHVQGCTHWTWTTYLGGTCWLKQGNTSRVYTSADANCGFVTSRFKVDESSGFDLGTGVSGSVAAASSVLAKDVLSVDDADSFLRVLNFYRLAYGKPKLSLDARLVLAAKELVQMCPPQSVDDRVYSETAKVPNAVDLGFHDGVYRLSLVTPASVTLTEALVVWGNVSDAASKPLLEHNTTIIGYAARRDTKCATAGLLTTTNSSGLTTVYSVLLATS